jgi:hypothetical protein
MDSVLTARYRIVRLPLCGMGVVLVYTPCWSLVGGVDGWRCVGVLAGPRGTSIVRDMRRKLQFGIEPI